MIVDADRGSVHPDQHVPKVPSEHTPDRNSRRVFLTTLGAAGLSLAGSLMIPDPVQAALDRDPNPGQAVSAAAVPSFSPDSGRDFFYQRWEETSTGKWLWIKHMGVDRYEGKYNFARAVAAMGLSYYTADVVPSDRRLRRMLSDENMWDLEHCFATPEFNDLVYGRYQEADPRDMTDFIREYIAKNTPIIARIPHGYHLSNEFEEGQYVMVTGHDEIWKDNGGKVFYNDPWPRPDGKGVFVNPATFRKAWGSEGTLQAITVHRI